MNLDTLNSLPPGEAETELKKCCGCAEWARNVANQRPFASVDELVQTADKVWWSVGEQGWLEAFHSHPRIGEKKAAATTSQQAQKWSEAEQSGTRSSSAETATALAVMNRTYEDKFGHIYIVCATGKTSQEMLENLQQRMSNNRDEELRVAASEQAKITELRLRNLVVE